jgi:sigma-B regulation protein RsbU (phosphoserine phosphatase)
MNEILVTPIENYKDTTNRLTEIGIWTVYKNASDAAHRLANLLHDKKKPFNYDELRKDKELRDVATKTIRSLKGYRTNVNYINVYDTGGTSVWHPFESTITNIEGRSYLELASEYQTLKEMVERSFTTQFVYGRYTFFDLTHSNITKYGAMVRVPDTPFIAFATVSEGDYFDPFLAIMKNRMITTHSNAYYEIEETIKRSRILKSTYVLLFLSIIFVLVGTWFARTVTKPIVNLTHGVHQIGTGDFTAKVPEEGTPETLSLAHEFNDLGEKLHTYMENLKEETALLRIYENEIKIAREIQESLVPCQFPAFPEWQEFNLHAVLNPAKEIAGDFYDYFFIDENTLVIMIGDVSGKSVPGALFMGITRTLLRSICEHIGNPAQVLKAVNNYLCEENEACMFVTVFLGYYNVRSGCLTYANAGHHQAYRLAAGGTTHEFGMLGNPALGIMPEDAYNVGNEIFYPGDKLVLFTDGITEAFSPQEEMFGEERFKELLIECHEYLPDMMCSEIISILEEFQEGEIFDDITMLVLQRNA